jgi:acyl-coenzyme A synthetase/AMP-(fatty) acid ligase
MFTGPTIAKGYYNHDEATQKSFIKQDDGKIWFLSDTYGSVHGKARRLFKLGARVREYFITSDNQGSFVKVYSGNVEDTIISSGLVEDCIVVQSDAGATPRPVAYVSLRTDVKMSKEYVNKIILDACKSLEEFARPVEIFYEDTIARTPNAGKKDYVYYKKKRNIN